MLHAPFAAESEGRGVAGRVEGGLVEDPVVVGVGGEGALDAGDGAGDVGGGEGGDCYGHGGWLVKGFCVIWFRRLLDPDGRFLVNVVLSWWCGVVVRYAVAQTALESRVV